MFHRAVDLRFDDGTILEVTFQDGLIKTYDMALLFEQYPQLKALGNRDLFCSGKLCGGYGIVWSNDLDIDAEFIYEDGMTVRHITMPAASKIGSEITWLRNESGLTQKQLAELTGIDQSDLSKIERGAANPSVATLERIAKALGGELEIKILKTEKTAKPE